MEPITITKSDVLYGKGNGVAKHLGNQYFSELIKQYQEEYQSYCNRVASNLRKNAIAMGIIELIKCQDPPGRFLVQQKKHGPWTEQEDPDLIRGKVTQALREKRTKLKGGKKAAIKRRQVKPLMTRRYQCHRGVAVSTPPSGRENDNASLNKESVVTLLSEEQDHHEDDDSQYLLREDEVVTNQEFLKDMNIHQQREVPPDDNNDGGIPVFHVLKDMEYFEDTYSCSSLPLDKPTIDKVLAHDTSLIGKSISICSTSDNHTSSEDETNDHQVEYHVFHPCDCLLCSY